MTSSTPTVFLELLTDLHRSIDRLADDLSRDEPRLAQALRSEAAWIPRPESLVPGPPPSSASARDWFRPLLYRALDAGIVDARRFDTLMLRGTRTPRERAP